MADAPPLALMGSGDAEIPDEIVDHVIDLGFVADEDRDTVYAAASILVHPSVMESLGMVVLEAWLVGLPVIVNRSCAVLVDHCRESNGGLWFRNADEFCGAVTAILEDPDLGRQLAQNGAEYTLDHYSWTSVRQRLFTSLERWS